MTYEARLVVPLPRVWPRRAAAGLGLLAVAAPVVARSRPGEPLRPPCPIRLRGRLPSRPDPSRRIVIRPTVRRLTGAGRTRPLAFAPQRPSPANSADIARDGALRPAAGLDRAERSCPDPGGVETLPAP